jgi:hypothetical protein
MSARRHFFALTVWRGAFAQVKEEAPEGRYGPPKFSTLPVTVTRSTSECANARLWSRAFCQSLHQKNLRGIRRLAVPRRSCCVLLDRFSFYLVTLVVTVTELLPGLGSGLSPPIVIVFVTVPGVVGTLIVM